MIENFKRSLQVVLESEGGWSDHPRDPGGATMKGVTLETFRFHFGRERTKNELRNITNDQLEYIYKVGYWNMCNCDNLPSGVDLVVFDGAVNSGPGRSARWLQSVVNTFQDGAIGPITLSRVSAQLPDKIIKDYSEVRLAFLKRLRTWDTFGRGWQARVEKTERIALEYAN